MMPLLHLPAPSDSSERCEALFPAGPECELLLISPREQVGPCPGVRIHSCAPGWAWVNALSIPEFLSFRTGTSA